MFAKRGIVKNRLFASLRSRLVFLILGVVIPSLALFLYSSNEGRNQDRYQALNDAHRAAKNISALYSQIITETRQALFILSQMPEFQRQDPEVCSRILANILRQTDIISSFSAARLNGVMFVSAPTVAMQVSFADRPWFQRVVKTRSFVIGEYSVGRVSGKRNIVLGYPVLDGAGRLVTILSVELDLDLMSQKLSMVKLPEGANLTIADSDGTILHRLPDSDKFVGEDMPEKSIIKAMLTKKEGTVEGVGLAGVNRLFGFSTIGEGIESIHICVGIPSYIAFAQVNRHIVRDISLLGVVLFLALLGTWIFGRRLIMQPVNRLIDVTKRVAAGDRDVRTSQSDAVGEFGALAFNFDCMTEAIQQHENELRASEKKYRLHFENISDVIYSFNREFTILSISPSVERILGYPPEAFIGKNFMDLNILPPEYLEEAFSEALRALAGERTEASVYEFIAKDGTRRFGEISSTPLFRDGQVEGVISVARDITDRKHAENELLKTLRELRETRDMLIQAEKLAAVGRLSAGIAHEVLNPVNTLSMRLQLLDVTEPLSENARISIQICQDQLRRITEITKNLTRFARVSGTKMITGDLNELLDRVLTLMSPRLEVENVGTEIQYQRNLPMVQFDDDRLQQVVLNIINNALDAMSGSKKKTLHISTKLKNEHVVRIVFSDNGAGIEPGQLGQIFDPFFTTKAPGKGTGLGLFISYEIIKEHAGNIWAENNKWGGATFFIELPAKQEVPGLSIIKTE